jgi:hypothetical protein
MSIRFLCDSDMHKIVGGVIGKSMGLGVPLVAMQAPPGSMPGAALRPPGARVSSLPLPADLWISATTWPHNTLPPV